MYFIENVAFQFDSLDRIDKEDKWVLSEAASNEEYTIKDVIISSDYLLQEECHPVVHESVSYTHLTLPTSDLV